MTDRILRPIGASPMFYRDTCCPVCAYPVEAGVFLDRPSEVVAFCTNDPKVCQWISEPARSIARLATGKRADHPLPAVLAVRDTGPGGLGYPPESKP